MGVDGATQAREAHVKVTEEVMEADCYYGECEHTEELGYDDCPLVSMEVCSDCRVPSGDDIEWLKGWDDCERDGHADECSTCGGARSDCPECSAPTVKVGNQNPSGVADVI